MMMIVTGEIETEALDDETRIGITIGLTETKCTIDGIEIGSISGIDYTKRCDDIK